MRALLEAFDVAVVDALEVAKRHPVEVLGGWELKPYAIQHSRFERVLYIDADNLPVRDPADLFDWDSFAATGAVFWPDIVQLRADNPIWELCGLDHQEMPSFETGEMVLDKPRAWPALALCTWLNQCSDLLYQHLYGDKDTFLLAWRLRGLPFHQVSHPVKQLPFVLCQFDDQGKLLFQHRSNAKWVLFGNNRRIEGFQYEDGCLELLRELRSKWNGKVFHPPARSTGARRIEAELASQRRFRLVRPGTGSDDIDLLPACRIGTGAGRQELYWYVEDGAEGPVLVLEGYDGRSAALRPGKDGAWRGDTLTEAAAPLVLESRERDRSETWPERPPPEAEGLPALAESVLRSYRDLPMDRDNRRDLEGTLRSLLRLDPGLAAALRALVDGGGPGEAVAAAVASVLAELPPDRPRLARGVRRGHNARNNRLESLSKYDRET